MAMGGAEILSSKPFEVKPSSEDADNPKTTPETEHSIHAENEEIEGGQETKNGSRPSPRSAPDSGPGMDSCYSISGIFEKYITDNGVAGDLMSYGNLHWKKMVDQVKKTSVWNFSTISVLMGQELYKSTKTLKKKMDWRWGPAEEEEFSLDDGEFAVPKPSWRNFSYEELQLATDDFSSDRMIGKGGHAEVYKGCLPDGEVVAVKKITKEDKNDEDKVGDFLAELGILAHVDNPNTAKLIGFSADQGLHLVLQFSPHGSLSTLLHGVGELLEWRTRYKVAKGVAEGLHYLHCDCQKRIIHRDITASNILFSQDYDAQISDFGLAKWLPEKWGHLVITPVEGTFGYMAPEYFMHGMVDEKTDVFAFGVLLLELITGRRAVDSSQQSLVMWAKPLLEKKKVAEIADPRLGKTYDVVEMERVMFTALMCIHNSPTMRPNMQRAVQLLKGEKERLDMKQTSIGGRHLILDACDVGEYSSTTYRKDLDRHMELVME